MASTVALTATIYHVDLTRGSIETKTIPEAIYRQYPGGSSLAAYLVLQSIPKGADPLGPDNVLALAVSPLTGLPISGQSRMTACARSPLTGAIGDSQCGGFFPAEMKWAGADAFVFTGKAPEPVYLWLKDGKAELRPAKHLWGKVTADADRMLKEEIGDDKIEIAQIGPAGENRVRFAAIMNMVNRANGRTGMGAVMGSKNLKAVVVRGTKPNKPAMPDEFRELVRRKDDLEKANPGIKWFGEFGTAGVLAIQDKMGGQPTRNYSEGTFEAAKEIDGSVLAKTILKERDTCYACVVKCKRVVEVREPGMEIDPVYGGPEYETLTFFGTMCGVGDLKLLSKASADANKFGMDTISCGATIAWAMDAKAKGLLDDRGLGLAFGDGQSVLRAIEAIALRQGAGDLLAEGSLRAAKTLGQDAVDLTVTVKGQEFPAHMPQHKRSLGLIYAVNPFGADHQSSEHDTALRAKPDSLNRKRLNQVGEYGDLPLQDLSDTKVKFAYETQSFYSALDTYGLCQFVWGTTWQMHGPSETVELVKYGTGWDVTMDEVMKVGERRIHLLRAFNTREGIGKESDVLPKKMFQPLTGKGPTAGVALTPEEFEKARDTYYRLAGCDPATGATKSEKLAELGLQWTERPGADPLRVKNASIRGLGEVVLRVKDLDRMRAFYTTVIGLEILKEFEGITFFRIAEGRAGHTEILGMFAESRPLPVPERSHGPVAPATTSLHHFALEIDAADYPHELDRLGALGVPVTTAIHAWCQWRSIYVLDPEDNVVELVCHDPTVADGSAQGDAR